MSASASSRKKLVGNEACDPALAKPKSYQWMPNDRKPTINFSFGGAGVYLRDLELEWGTVPKTFRIDCYTDQYNFW